MSILNKIFGKKNNPGATYQRRYAVVSPAQQAQQELQRDITLAGVTEANVYWQAFLSLVDEHAQSELESALRPGLDSEQRQYAAGAAASADFLATMVRDARLLAAQKVSRKKESE